MRNQKKWQQKILLATLLGTMTLGQNTSQAQTVDLSDGQNHQENISFENIPYGELTISSNSSLEGNVNITNSEVSITLKEDAVWKGDLNASNEWAGLSLYDNSQWAGNANYHLTRKRRFL